MRRCKTAIPYKQITARLVQEIVGEFFGVVKITKFKLIKTGFENVSIDLRVKKKRYVIRIYNRLQFDLHKRDNQSILWELAFIEHLYKKGMPVPRIISTLSGKKFIKIKHGKYSYFVVVAEYIRGKHLSRITLKQEKEVVYYIALMHKYARSFKTRYRRPPLDCLGFEKRVAREKKVRSFRNSNHIKLVNEIRKVLITLSPIVEKQIKTQRHIPVHNDLHLGNVKFLDGRISGIFDFDDCLMGIASAELGKALFFILQKRSNAKLVSREVDSLLDHYASICPLTKKDCQVAKQALVLSWAAHRVYLFRGTAKNVREAKAFIACCRAIIG